MSDFGLTSIKKVIYLCIVKILSFTPIMKFVDLRFHNKLHQFNDF
jgi:hypothetical protein